MAKVLLFSFGQRFGPFTIVYFARTSEAGLLNIYLSTSFEVRKLKNISAMTAIFFLKLFKIECKFSKRKEKVTRYFFLYR